jgi:predicted DNA-binding transcriptional regulator YafY
MRIFAMLELLQNRGVVSAEELSRTLEIDIRTVRRYATALRDLAIPLESVRGRYGGYRLTPSYPLPPLIFSEDEAVAVAAALAAARAREGTGSDAAGSPAPSIPDATDRALVKLTRLLPDALRAQVAQRAETASGSTGGLRPAGGLPPGPEIILTLTEAIRARHRVRIVHEREGGPSTSRQVDPYGVVVRGRDWYLVGHDHLREAHRVYRIDRISMAEELPYRFSRPEGYDPIAHVLRALRLDARRHRTEFTLDVEGTGSRVAGAE